ncbi:hypothetical protein M413DRAFT_449442 [Hebeloma cylindrosporum]|uniref:Uncharacterized protein n=1 Tax=Hebeloma cylindrosporum TaxID=76867 RepID=A0A0C3BX12_HEBCY|nr:hypothetical protein M413DRAFT_449442 [Hebeloma cylindrosporum h7]
MGPTWMGGISCAISLASLLLRNIPATHLHTNMCWMFDFGCSRIHSSSPSTTPSGRFSGK